MNIDNYSYYELINNTIKRIVFKLGSLIYLQLVVVMIIFIFDFFDAMTYGSPMTVPYQIYMASITTYGGKSLLNKYIDIKTKGELNDKK